MQYKKVKMIKEPISAIGIGCWNFGGDFDTSDDTIATSIVHASIEHGINLFDVAPVYGWTHSEIVLGKALKGKRDKVLIASKCGLTWNEKHETKNDLSKKNILREIDESLTRLQTDYIDIYQLHWPDHETPIEETVEALRIIKEAGKIKYIGLSNFSPEDVKTFMSMIEINAQQSLYNMLERNTLSYHNIPLEYRTEKDVLPVVLKEGQAFLPYSPLFQGLLAGKFTREKTFSAQDIRSANPKLSGDAFLEYFACYEKLDEVAQEIGKPINELAINWLRQKEEVTSIIGGASSIAQLDKNVEAVSWDISDEAMAKINEIIAPFEDK
jgi:aryl-alcohol dehydrogenase-like predicted oxidoreductase